MLLIDLNRRESDMAKHVAIFLGDKRYSQHMGITQGVHDRSFGPRTVRRFRKSRLRDLPYQGMIANLLITDIYGFPSDRHFRAKNAPTNSVFV
jgi:hypothetical protein